MANTNQDPIEAYIKSCAAKIRPLLRMVRKSIRKNAPGSSETIKYRMPTFVLDGRNLIHYAAFKSHLGIYPMPSAIVAFRRELLSYVSSKGAIQFPFDRPIPYELIEKIVRFRVEEVSAKKSRPSRARRLSALPQARGRLCER